MYKLIIKPGFEVDEILDILGDHALFSSEEQNGESEIVVEGPGPWDERTFPFIKSATRYDVPTINWEEQWELYGPGFKDGIMEVPVGESSIRMKAGPGFGNLSHPTTYLVMNMMEPFCKDNVVLDIGTGSGILAIAAASLQAKKVYAIDIDQASVQHAKENAEMNGFQIAFEISNEKIDLYLLNMIWSEQKQALATVNVGEGWLIASGILEGERAAYLEFTKDRGWRCTEEQIMEGWCAFLFDVP